MPPVEIKKDICWVGAIDWNLRNFHGYSQAKLGTTYNAYLVLDEKKTLFDTVSKSTTSEMLDRIREVTDPESIDYIVVNHAEPDHSGALPELIRTIKPEQIFCSKMCLKSLSAHYDVTDWPLVGVEPGRTISLGARTTTFMETRMLHWPDSMFSYIPEEKLLISSDAFGQNLATSERFDDEVDFSTLMGEALHYYANIITPYSNLVRKVIDKVRQSGLEIDMIAPDHGVVWRSHAAEIVNRYDEWSRQPPSQKVIVVYDTMWHSTEKMARAIAEGVMREGMSVRIMSCKAYHHSDIMAEVFSAGGFVVGSPTHNNTILPLVADVMTYIRGLRPINKVGAAFGSYGWSGESTQTLNTWLTEMGMDVIDPVKAQFVPTADQMEQCVQLGREVARKVKEKSAA